MDILDKHFVALPAKKKVFLIIISLSYFLIALIGFKSGLMNIVESFFLFVIGILYTELIKLRYRIEDLEKKKK